MASMASPLSTRSDELFQVLVATAPNASRSMFHLIVHLLV